jgi:hypothetical protein
MANWALERHDGFWSLKKSEGDARLNRYVRANLEEHAYRVQTVNSGLQFLR